MSQTLFRATNEEVNLGQRGKCSSRATTLLAIVIPTLLSLNYESSESMVVYNSHRDLRHFTYDPKAVRILSDASISNALIAESQFIG